MFWEQTMAPMSHWGPSLGIPLELQRDLAAVTEGPWNGFGTLLILTLPYYLAVAALTLPYMFIELYEVDIII